MAGTTTRAQRAARAAPAIADQAAEEGAPASEAPAYADCVFMYRARGERAEINQNSIDIMRAFGWRTTPPEDDA